MKNHFLPKKFQKLWRVCSPFLKRGRPDDFKHAKDVIKFIVNYSGPRKINQDILIPVAIMHDIGHSAILPQHFKYVTGPQKIKNSKLVHMLAGAKIAAELMKKIKYPTKKTREIIDIISIHDAEQLDIEWRKIYNTYNKKIFHDIDLLDGFNIQRVKRLLHLWSKNKLIQTMNGRLNNFFFEESKKLAIKKIENLKKLK